MVYITDEECLSAGVGLDPAVGDEDDFVAEVLGSEDTEGVVDGTHEIGAWEALVFVEEDAVVIVVGHEVLGDEILVVGEDHVLVLNSIVEKWLVVHADELGVVDSGGVDTLTPECGSDCSWDVLVSEDLHAVSV